MFGRTSFILPIFLCFFFFPSAQAQLVWDKELVKTEATHGTKVLILRFPFSNAGPEPVFLTKITPSCGCMESLASDLPWAIVPGVEETLEIKVNLQGKKGLFRQSVEVVAGNQTTELHIEVDIEDPIHRPMTVEEREGNLALSQRDRTAIFRGDCAACHTKPTQGKYGRTLYESACGICHDSEQRASIVPDLKDKIATESKDYWRNWIINGKEGGVMPGFAASEGGPLSNSQISTLLNHISRMKRDQAAQK